MPELSADIPNAPSTLVPESPAEVALSAIEENPERQVKKLGFGFWLATAWLVVLITLCVLAPVLPFVLGPGEYSDSARELIAQGENVPPSPENWFGADEIGHDVFSQVIWGGRTSLLIGVSAVLFGFVLGGTLGLTAGYFGGRYERVVIDRKSTRLNSSHLGI